MANLPVEIRQLIIEQEKEKIRREDALVFPPAPVLKAIETQYRGYRFRSRTEARWAVFMDALKWDWTYEHEGYDLGDGLWYLPDFWLPTFECFIEIKGVYPSPFERQKAEKLCEKSGHPVVIISGQAGCERIVGFTSGRDWHHTETWAWKDCSKGCVGLGPLNPNELWIGGVCDRDMCDCTTQINVAHRNPGEEYGPRLQAACEASRFARFE